jgi:thiamine biosynthesis lipoprotein
MSRVHTLRFDFQAMASPCSLQIDATDDARVRRAAAAAIVEVRRIEQAYSRYRNDSIISRINRSAGTAGVETDAETASLLDFAGQLHGLSDGLFDITSGVLRKAWDFKRQRPPQPDVVAALLPKVGWQKVERKGRLVRLAEAGMELDFGGIGKEYAADRAAAVLQAHGVAHALVNLGGDLHALGARAVAGREGNPWQVAIAHPRAPHGYPDASIAQLALVRGALATSGDYERFFIHEGKRYCHILNPLTGMPVAFWQSVSVLANNATSAGALSTIAMLKEADGLKWLDGQGACYLAVQADGALHRHTGASDA